MFMTVWGDCLSFPGSLYTPTHRKLLLQCRIDFIHLHIAITTFTDCWLPVSNDLFNRLIGSLSASQSVWQRYRLVTQKPLPLKHDSNIDLHQKLIMQCYPQPPLSPKTPGDYMILKHVTGNRMPLKQQSYECVTLSKSRSWHLTPVEMMLWHLDPEQTMLWHLNLEQTMPWYCPPEHDAQVTLSMLTHTWLICHWFGKDISQVI